MSDIFHGYSQSSLDAQYDLRKAVADSAEHVAYRETRSAHVRSQVPCRLDIAYGPSDAERMDLFPATPGPAGKPPALVYVHGGYWQLSDKGDTSFLAPTVTAAGATFVALNYALAPAVTMDRIVAQIRGAIAHIWREADGLGIDRDRIILAGHSAGGHLTAMAAATDWPAVSADLPADPIKAACALSGLYDLEPIRLCFLNRVLRLDEDAAGRNSPLTLAPRMTGPILLALGEDETPEYHRQQAALAARWRAAGADIRTLSVPGAHHYSIVRTLADGQDPMTAAISGLIAGPAQGNVT